MSVVQKWIGGSIKLKIATVAMVLNSLIYLIWGLGFAADLGVGFGTVVVFFLIDLIAAVGLFLVKKWGKAITILDGLYGLITLVVSILNPSIEIFGFELEGLFQASGVAIAWSICQVIGAIFVIIADDFKKIKQQA
jgi:hypothetical protein